MNGSWVLSSSRAPVSANHALENTGVPPAKPIRSRGEASSLKLNRIVCGPSTSTLSMKPSTMRRYSVMPCSWKRLKENATSSAVIGVPLAKRTSSRRLKVT